MDKRKPPSVLEVIVISAEDLRIHNRSINKNAFVVIQTDDSTICLSTSVDKEGGSYPSWNEKMEFPFYHNVRFIKVEVQCKSGSSVRMIGEAKIPVSDFDRDSIPTSYLHFLSYRLRERNGDRNGIVNLSIRLNAPRYNRRRLTTLGVKSSSNEIDGGIAMGIPFSYGCKV